MSADWLTFGFYLAVALVLTVIGCVAERHFPDWGDTVLPEATPLPPVAPATVAGQARLHAEAEAAARRRAL